TRTSALCFRSTSIPISRPTRPSWNSLAKTPPRDIVSLWTPPPLPWRRNSTSNKPAGESSSLRGLIPWGVAMGRDAFRFLPLFLPAGAAARQPDWQPSADVYRTRKGWLVKFDLAGVRPQDIELSVHDNTLSVRGERRDCLVEEGCRHYRMEIAYDHFERSIE